jgi:hypothetical protein
MVGIVGRTGVSQNAQEIRGQEIRQQLLLLELVDPSAAQQRSPIGQLRAQRIHAIGQAERIQMRPKHIGAEQRFGFDRQGNSLGRRQSGVSAPSICTP